MARKKADKAAEQHKYGTAKFQGRFTLFKMTGGQLVVLIRDVVDLEKALREADDATASSK